MKKNAKISQQKGRRVPIHFQKQLDKKIEKLLTEGHIERVEKIEDDVFIQPTVIILKKGQVS